MTNRNAAQWSVSVWALNDIHMVPFECMWTLKYAVSADEVLRMAVMSKINATFDQIVGRQGHH